jgi:hypothetical protein
MTSKKATTRTKTGHLFGALAALVAMLAAILVAGGIAMAATTTFGNPSPIPIEFTYNYPYPSQISVQNMGGTVSDVNVELNGYSHGFPDDTDVLLVGSQGQKVVVMSDAGGSATVSSANLTLDDEATNPLPDNDQITSGAYRPTQGTGTSSDCTTSAGFPDPAPAGPYATNLSAFDGTDPNGTWDLYVVDDCITSIVGQFAGGWSLEITTEGTAPQPGAPRVQSTSPQAGATGVSPAVNVTATFSEEMQASTINNATFKLFKQGSTTKVGASVRYDAAADKATLDPTNSLKRGATYKALVTTEAEDVAGNRLDQKPSLSGRQQKVWDFKVKN